MTFVHGRMRRILVLVCTLFVISCASGKEISERSDNGFNFTQDAFSSPNFGGADPGARMRTALAVRMFGKANVCEANSDPCVPTKLAENWIASVNATLEAGRSEGFAVLALLFHLKRLSPQDFGAATVAALEFEDNIPLKEELAYWAATQKIPELLEDTKTFQAKDVMPFLREILTPGKTEAWRLAIAIKTEAGFKGGHALVPFGYTNGERDGLYYLRVYDNNIPQEERRITLDTVANTWTYDGSTDASAPLIYSGNGTNGNLLYFAPVTPRIGVLPCPFAAGATTMSVSSSGALNVLVTNESGAQTGMRDGEVIEESGRVMPSFSKCTCTPPRTIMDTYVDFTEDQTIAVSSLGEYTENGGTLNVTGENFSSTVTGIRTDASSSDTMKIESFGKKVTYQTQSDSEVSMTSSFSDVSSNTTTRVIVTIGGASTSVIVDASNPSNIVVGAGGVASGTSITVTVVSTTLGQTRTTTTTFTSAGTDAQVEVDTFNRVADVNTDAILDPCTNNQWDEGESDVDCGGGGCVDCGVGKSCTNDNHCLSPLVCNTNHAGYGTCVAIGCSDGRQNGHETDIDCGGGCYHNQTVLCGGACPPCESYIAMDPIYYTAQKTCVKYDDCTSNICINGKCQGKAEVGAAVWGLGAGTLLVTIQTEPRPGQTPPYLEQITKTLNASSRSPYWEILGSAYAYKVTNFETSSRNWKCRITQGISGYAPTAATFPIVFECGVSNTALRVQSDTVCGGTVKYNISIDGYYHENIPHTGSFNTWGLLSSLPGAQPSTQPLNYYSSYYVKIAEQPEIFQGINNRWYHETCALEGANADGEVIGRFAFEPSKVIRQTCTCSACFDDPDNCPPDPGGGGGGGSGIAAACTSDTDCDSKDCQCGANSGSCTNNSGHCGAGKKLFNIATIDGSTSSGTFTIPAQCSSIYVEAWGAAGAYGGSDDGGFGGDGGGFGGGGFGGGGFLLVGQAGGAGGFASGILSTTPGDELTVWIGEAGQVPIAFEESNGRGGHGSLYGVSTPGGSGEGVSFFGGGGGGLTSIQLKRSGTVITSFTIPAGSGAGAQAAGIAVAADVSGDASSNAGGDAGISSAGGGGGAGEPGGTGAPSEEFSGTTQSGFAGNPGAWGTLPSGITSIDGPDPDGPPEGSGATPGGTSYPDYSGLCASTAGTGNAWGTAGDGCVVVRCIAP